MNHASVDPLTYCVNSAMQYLKHRKRAGRCFMAEFITTFIGNLRVRMIAWYKHSNLIRQLLPPVISLSSSSGGSDRLLLRFERNNSAISVLIRVLRFRPPGLRHLASAAWQKVGAQTSVRFNLKNTETPAPPPKKKTKSLLKQLLVKWLLVRYCLLKAEWA